MLPLSAIFFVGNLARSSTRNTLRLQQRPPGDDGDVTEFLAAKGSLIAGNGSLIARGMETTDMLETLFAERTQQDALAANETEQGRHRIPSHIFLCARSASITDLSATGQSNLNRTLALNPDMAYTLYGDEECKVLLRGFGDQDIEELFARSLSGKYRSDICRAVFLYLNGGFYVDTDMEPIVPFSTLVQPETSFMSAWAADGDILNALIAIEPKSPIMYWTLHEMKRIRDVHAFREVPAVHVQTDEVADATSSLDHFMMRKHNADSSKGNSHEADSRGADSAVTKPSADDAVNTLMDPNFMKLSGTEDDLHGRAMQFVASNMHGYRTDLFKPSFSLSESDSAAQYRVWGPRTLFLGLTCYFLNCKMATDDMPSAKRGTIDFSFCGQSIRMYQEVDMVRLLAPETRNHRGVMKLRFGAAADLSVDLLRKALSRENRSNSTFMGVRYGIFYPGKPNFLVAYTRYSNCTAMGCADTKVQMADLGETTAGLAATFHAALPAGDAPGKKPGASAGTSPEARDDILKAAGDYAAAEPELTPAPDPLQVPHELGGIEGSLGLDHATVQGTSYTNAQIEAFRHIAEDMRAKDMENRY